MVTAFALASMSHVLRIESTGVGIKVPHTDVLVPSGDLTVEAWVHPRRTHGKGLYQFIVSKNYGGTGYALVMIGSGDHYRFQFEANDTISYDMHMNALESGWWHVAGVLESGKYIKLYVNGIAVAFKETKATMQPNSLPLYLGTSSLDTFMGDIDDVMIWNEMRTQEQILADSRRSPKGTEKNLVAFWDFERVRSGKLYDRTHHTRPGVLLNKPKFPSVSKP